MLGTRLLAHLLGRRVRAEEEDAHLEGGRAVQKAAGRGSFATEVDTSAVTVQVSDRP